MCMNSLNQHLASQAADPLLIYIAKKVITMERGNPEATAVAVSGKQVLVAGSLDEVPYRVANRTAITGAAANRLGALLMSTTRTPDENAGRAIHTAFPKSFPRATPADCFRGDDDERRHTASLLPP